ncbi:MAG: hypothetical protein KTR25_15615 [Myxococcales bacterium]|nr:hypothetical protein [Myxococcales bacterium]
MTLRSCLLTVGLIAGLGTTTGCEIESIPDELHSNDLKDVLESALTKAFPRDLVLASPTRSSRLSQAMSVASGGSYAAKRRVLQRMLSGTLPEDCRFNFKVAPRPSRPIGCYGPAITYTNHPDAPATDEDWVDNDPPNTPNDTDGDGRLPTGDVGIWREYQNDEACAAAVLNSKVSSIEAQVDTGIYAMASLMCHANQAGVTVPDVSDGADLDLTEVVASGFEQQDVPVTVSKASIKWVDNSYVSELIAEGLDPSERPVRIKCRLRHRSNDTSYRGKISCLVESTAGNTHSCGPSATGMTRAFSINYLRNTDSVISYEARSAEFCGTQLRPWLSDSNYTLDAKSSEMRGSLGWVNNFNVAKFQFNVESGSGQYVFAWQAGGRDSHSRILGLKIGAASNDVSPSGCAYFGYGPRVQEDPDRPQGMICNWAGPGNSHVLQDVVQRQCLVWDEVSGYFISEASKLAITYAPTNSCSTSGVDALNQPFSYSDGVTTTTGSVAHDLVDAGQMSTIGITSPPGDIDAL